MSNIRQNIENASRNALNISQKDIPSAGREVFRHPLQALTGLGVGAALAIPNNLATVGYGAQGLANFALGKEKPFENLDKYNKWGNDVNRAVVTGIPISDERGGMMTPIINTAGAVASGINNTVGGIATPIINSAGKLLNNIKIGDAHLNLPTNIPSRQEYSPQAAGVGAAVGDLLGPGAYFKAIGKVPGLGALGNAAGGIPAIAAQATIGADRYLGQPLLRGAANVTSALGDPILKGAAKVGEVSKSKLVNPIADSLDNTMTGMVKNAINPRLPEDILKLETDQNIINRLSALAGKPASRIDDIGEYLYNSKLSQGQKFQDELTTLTDSKARAIADAKLKGKSVDDIDKLKDSYDSKIQKFKDSGPEESFNNKEIDNFIKNDLGYDPANMDKKNLAVIRDQFKGAYNKHIKNLEIAEGDSSFDKAFKLYDEAKANGTEDFTQHFDNIIKSGKDRVTNALNKLDDAVFENDPELYKANKDFLEKTFDDTASKIASTGNENLAKRFVDEYKTTASARIAKIALMGKFENAASDAFQYARNQGAVMENRLASRGIDYAEYLKNRNGASKWEKENPLFVDKLYAEKNKTTADAFGNSSEYSNLLDPAKRLGKLPPQVKDFMSKLRSHPAGNIFDAITETLGYGMQHSVRRYVTRDIIHDAYAIAKAEGLVEGTKEFNQFVKNEADALMVENGFSNVKTTFGTLDENGKAIAIPSFDDYVKGAIEKSVAGYKLPRGLAKEAASAMSYMGTWVKGATIANNKSFNNAIDALSRISKTGKVTQADRVAIFRSIYDQAINLAIFGARGSRAAGSYTELPGNPIGSDTKDSLSTKFSDWVTKDILGYSDDKQRLFRDGLLSTLTGTATDRQLNTPLIGTNPQILEGTLGRYISMIGNPNLDDNLAKFVPKEIQSAVDAKLGEGLKNYKGDDITSDLSETAQNSPSVQSGIGYMLNKPTLPNVEGITALKNDEQGILNKYDRYTLEEIIADKKLKKEFKADMLRIGIDMKTPEGVDRFIAMTDMLKAADDKFPTSTMYKKLNADASKILARDKNSPEFRDVKETISEDKAIQIAAEAVLNGKVKVLEVLLHLGFKPDKEFKKSVREKMKEIQARNKDREDAREADNSVGE